MYRSSSSHKVNSALHLLGYVSKMSMTDGGLAGLLQLFSTWVELGIICHYYIMNCSGVHVGLN